MRRRAVLSFAVVTLGLLAGVLVWRSVPGFDGRIAGEPRQLSPFQRANVEWLLENRLPCLGCHVINGRGGRLGPDLTDVGTRMSADAIEEHLLNPQARNPASIMPPVLMPDPWRKAVASYLGDEPSGELTSRSVTTAARKPDAGQSDPAQSALVYRQLCGGCHGDTGQGHGPNAPHLPVAPTRHADPVLMSSRTDDWLFDIIARGGYPMNRHPFMPPYGHLLGSQEIRGLVSHLRHLCGCATPEWSRDGQSPTRRP